MRRKPKQPKSTLRIVVNGTHPIRSQRAWLRCNGCRRRIPLEDAQITVACEQPPLDLTPQNFFRPLLSGRRTLTIVLPLKEDVVNIHLTGSALQAGVKAFRALRRRARINKALAKKGVG